VWAVECTLKMAGVPTSFQAISGVLANYNFVDIAAGTGYINFYAGTTVDKYLLSNFTFYSNTYVNTVSLTGADAKLLDLDFDTVLNRPLDIKGLGIVNIPVYRAGIGGGFTSHIYCVVTLRKWNGAETDIIANTSTDVTGTVDPEYKMLAVDLDIPLTHFKIGETVRLTIAVWGGSSGGGQPGAIAYDPMNRSALWDTTGACPSKLILQLPVRLNL
jgi:hypothetical protein